MKRLILVLTVCGLLLCACGKQEPDSTISTKPSAADTTVAPKTETTEAAKQAEFRHPLTGVPMDQPYTGRPLAVVINNIEACLPQYGISSADIMYEAETEGGITRCLAVFTDLSDTGSVGPIRSCRTYFNDISLSYDAPLFHCGGSVNGLKGRYGEDGGTSIKNWQHVDGRSESSFFFRDQDRYKKQHYAWEHTLFTNAELLHNAMEAKGFQKAQSEPVTYGLQFSEDVNLSGESAKTVTVKFRGGKTTTMTYNETSGLYEAAQYGAPHKDAGTDEVMSYRNVLVLYTDHWFADDGYYNRSYYDLVGSGKGHLAIGGKIVPITWHREDPYGPFSYTLEDGTPVTLGVGHSYVGIASTSSTASYQ